MPLLKTLLFFSVATAFAAEPEFKSIFDGRTLKGWETPVTSYWTVEEGAITGRISKENPCTTNQYLVWAGGELADFELKLKSRLNGEGGINNGFQFRSRLLPDHDICGYQVDNNLQTDWLVRLYDEFGRHTLAMRGERANFSATGERVASKIPEAEGAAWFRLEDWHEYHLICRGPDITLRVDGRLACEVHDDDPRRREMQGVLGLQLHSGPPTVVQFKDIQLKILKPATPDPKPPKFSAAKLALQKEALAWWPLDTGGHGATPWLRHIPGWEKFELNVRADGPGATPNGNVVLMHGAYFEAAPDLLANATTFTLHLRARGSKGEWKGGLITKENAFSLMAADGFLQFAMGDAKLRGQVGVDPDAWHDLMIRFDGKSVDLFQNGKQTAIQPYTGKFPKSSAPLLIAAKADSGKVADQFEGELEVAAIWSRALTDEEIAAFSGR